MFSNVCVVPEGVKRWHCVPENVVTEGMRFGNSVNFKTTLDPHLSKMLYY